jgi:uncharacterized membrane protein YsdA (DUF1294 family)
MSSTDTLGGFGRLEGRRPGWALKGAFAVCIAIGVAVVVRRLIALSTPPSATLPPQLANLDAAFAAHATLTYFHILCALLFVLLLPFLFLRRTRDSVLLERAVFVLGLVIGVSAFAMTRHAIGGWVERSAVLVFNTLFLFALLRAYLYAREGHRAQKQRWMLRAIAILLGIATTRPVMGVFFATATLTHLTPAQFFGIAFWIGFSVNTLAIELWLRSGRRTPARERSLV